MLSAHWQARYADYLGKRSLMHAHISVFDLKFLIAQGRTRIDQECGPRLDAKHGCVWLATGLRYLLPWIRRTLCLSRPTLSYCCMCTWY